MTQYLLDKDAYAQWFRDRFSEPPEFQLTAAGSTVIVELEGTSGLSTRKEKIVYVQVVAGSVGVSLGTGFVVPKRCLVRYGSGKLGVI